MFRRRVSHHRSRASNLKLIGYEDILVGIILGVLMIAYSGLLFTIPNISLFLPIALGLFILLALFDILHELKTIMQGFFFTLLAIASNAAEIFVSLVFVSKLGYVNLPFIMDFATYLESPANILFAGLFLVCVNIFWFYAYHFMK